MDFSYLIVGCTNAPIRYGTGETFTGTLRPLKSLTPCTVQLQKFRPPHETMPSIGNQIRLRRTPVLERRRPFLRALQVENLPARVEDAAINAAGVHWRHFIRR